MIFIENNTKLKVPKKKLKRIFKYLAKNRDIEVVICDNEYIRELNYKYRGVDKPTDVLSFPLNDEVGLSKTLGTIFISEDFVREGASKFGHKKREEILLLFIHGLLHLLGYDHESDNGEMRKKERELIDKFKLPKSLIVRVEDG